MLVVDDHELIRQGVAKLIKGTSFLTLTGEAESIDEAKVLLSQGAPDVAVVDLSLRDGHGRDLIRHVAQHHPETRIVVLSIHEDAMHVQEAFTAGAHGYVAKSDSADTLVDAIREVLRGERYLPPQLAGRVLARLQSGGAGEAVFGLLSKREREIFQLIGQGLTTRQIAEALHRSPKTIESHLERIKEKLGADSARALHQLAFQHRNDADA